MLHKTVRLPRVAFKRLFGFYYRYLLAAVDRLNGQVAEVQQRLDGQVAEVQQRLDGQVTEVQQRLAGSELRADRLEAELLEIKDALALLENAVAGSSPDSLNVIVEALRRTVAERDGAITAREGDSAKDV